ncbi:MAG: hypothetical protein WB341_11640 [Terracidiphilus sp.]
MNNRSVSSHRVLAVVCLTLGSIALRTAPLRAAATDGCGPVEPASAPRVAISNGLVSAVVLLPDANDGYYRGSRFDWSGVVGCLTYKGHNYFGAWFPEYNPTHHDSITGPVEEFRASDGVSAPGYDGAKPGEIFFKPGIGALRRTDTGPFSFAVPYPLVDGGKWTVHAGKRQVAFCQKLHTQTGISYVYKKKLLLEAEKPILVIEHELKNTGTEAMDMQVYNHDFFMLDAAPTGPGMVVRFPFTPKGDVPLGNGARVDGNRIVYGRELAAGQSVEAGISGFSDQPSDFDFVVENIQTGAGVEETGSLPLSRVYFWSIRTTICPEGYVHIQIAPGQTAGWTIRYRFFAK